MKKKFIWILCFIMCISQINALTVSAATGDQIVAMARKQDGKPYSSSNRLGPYSFDCSGLVWYVCNQLGISMSSGNCQSQMSYGTAVDYSAFKSSFDCGNLQNGDLIFFDYGGDGVADHVGIYSGNGNMIDALTSSYYGYKVVEHTIDVVGNSSVSSTKKFWAYTCGIRRVSSNLDLNPPQITNFSTLYSEYSIGSNPSISMSATNIGHYDTWLYRNGELIETGSTTENTYIFTSAIQDGYTYSARVTAINNLGNTISNLIYFKLKSKPSILSVKSKKASYYVGENPSISMSATNNGHYDVWLYKNGALIETGSTTNNTYTFSSVIEEGYTYSFRITAINDYGSVISDLVIFSTKKYNTLSIQKNEYSPEETITFTWSSLATASHYDFYIYNEKGEIFTTGTTKNTQISYKLNKGNYSARVTPVYNGGIVISNLIYFSVRINDDLASRDFTIQKYNGYAAVINNDVTRTATVILADYTNGVLTDISSQQVSFTQGQSNQFSYGNGAEHKIFVWDSLSGMKPLCESK